MRPRSSRSHSTLVPAESMIASTPHVTAPLAAPGDDRERAVRAACRERGPVAARGTTSSMPPVPKVILACPGAHAALPDERRLLVAGDAGDRRRTRQGRGLADARRSSRRRSGSMAAGMRSASSTSADPVRAVGAQQPGDAGVGEVGDVERALATASRRSRCRRCRSTGRASRSGSSRVEQERQPWWPTGSGPARMPSAGSSRQVPTVRRSCQPSAGPDGLAGRPVPHDRRRPLVGDADGLDRPARGERLPGHLEHGLGHGAGVELDEARRPACRAATAR